MSSKIYVGNLPYSVTDSSLESNFAEFGGVSSAKVMMDRETGRSKGFGFVEMANAQVAQAAISALHGMSVDGRSIVVNLARPRETTGAAGGYALPEVLERTILRILRDVSPMRQIATVRTVGSTDYKELVDVNGAAFEWVGEADARSQTNTSDLYEVIPTFGMASAKPQASEESLDDLFFNVEDWLVTSATDAIDQGEGAAFVSGNGTKKPTGFLAGPTPVCSPRSRG